MPNHKPTTPREISPEIQLQTLWFTTSRQGPHRHLPVLPHLRIYRHLSLSDVCGVICWVLLVTAALVFAIWMFLSGGV